MSGIKKAHDETVEKPEDESQDSPDVANTGTEDEEEGKDEKGVL